jgi:hypothetical protein
VSTLSGGHPFGNALLLRDFCLLNSRDLVLTVDDAEAMVVATAAGRVDVPDLAVLIGQHRVSAPR